MARTKHKLTALQVKQCKPGTYTDGDGLYLHVAIGADGERKRWWYVRVHLPGGKVREMGLGSADRVDLAAARSQANNARDLARDGIDPVWDRLERRRKAAEEVARSITFKDAAEDFLSANEESWKNVKHRKQWRSTLETYVYPILGSVPVQAVDVSLIKKVIDPLWKTKTETANRIRGRIETILDYAAVSGFRSGENPARWRGHLQRTLPPRARVQKVVHHRALPYSQLPDLMKRLRKNSSITARALEFTILTAARSGEVIGARWSEMDRVNGIWTIPADRMKAGREHRVPLGPRAWTIIAHLDDFGLSSDWVFPGARAGKSLSDMAMLELLRGMKVDAVTHGFRSTFRDWVSERTNHPPEVAEAALAHIRGDQTERAYNRSDLFERRALLMKHWDHFANGQPLGNKAVARRSLANIGRGTLATTGGSGAALRRKRRA